MYELEHVDVADRHFLVEQLAGATGARSVQISAVTSLIASIGIILLVPQGLVALVFSLVAPDIRLWFAPMYLPQELRGPSSLILALVGALMLAGA
ncbi:MAG TPA: hypothetical protein VGJ60_20135 [Chloroflexota bacterium]